MDSYFGFINKQPNAQGRYTKDDDYWTQFFVLRCNKPALIHSFEEQTPEKLLAAKQVTNELFVKATEQLETSHFTTIENTLTILSIFFTSIFKKKFVSYSSDIISVAAGLENIDKVFSRFLDAINKIISDGGAHLSTRVSAIRTTTVIAGGAQQSSLASCFLYRDIFGAIMDFINSPASKLYIGDAFSLLGILACYDKLEGTNPYQTRLADFVDVNSMTEIATASGHAWEICLNQYTQTAAVSSKLTGIEGIASWLMGVGSRSSNDEIQDTSSDKTASSNNPEQPHPAISLLLATYEFINANKMFAKKFIECNGEGTNSRRNSKERRSDDVLLNSIAPPLVVFISLSSYLLQDQSSSIRAASYSRLALIVYRIMLEDSSGSAKLLVKTKTTKFNLDNHRNHALTFVNSSRSLIEGILDDLQGCLRYNLKRTLDYDMYSLALTTLFQTLFFLKKSKTRLNYIWKDLWKTLLSLIKFMNSHSPKAETSPSSSQTVSKNRVEAGSKCADLVTLVIASCLIHGDSFLVSDEEYDDLYYKIVQAAPDISKFIECYSLQDSQSAKAVLHVCNYFLDLMDKNRKELAATQNTGFYKLVSFVKGPGGVDDLSSEDVVQLIRSGLEGLSLYQFVKPYEPLSEGLPLYKEADERLYLKKITKLVINDILSLYK